LLRPRSLSKLRDYSADVYGGINEIAQAQPFFAGASVAGRLGLASRYNLDYSDYLQPRQINARFGPTAHVATATTARGQGTGGVKAATDNVSTRPIFFFGAFLFLGGRRRGAKLDFSLCASPLPPTTNQTHCKIKRHRNMPRSRPPWLLSLASRASTLPLLLVAPLLLLPLLLPATAAAADAKPLAPPLSSYPRTRSALRRRALLQSASSSASSVVSRNVNCSALPGLQACAEPLCFEAFELRRNATTGDLTCRAIPPPSPSALNLVFSAYDGDYVFLSTGDNALAAASVLDNTNRGRRFSTREGSLRLRAPFEERVRNVGSVAGGWIGRFSQRRASTERASSWSVGTNGQRPLQTETSLGTGPKVAATSKRGFYAPGFTAEGRGAAASDDPAEQGGSVEDNVALDVTAPLLFGGKRRRRSRQLLQQQQRRRRQRRGRWGRGVEVPEEDQEQQELQRQWNPDEEEEEQQQQQQKQRQRVDADYAAAAAAADDEEDMRALRAQLSRLVARGAIKSDAMFGFDGGAGGDNQAPEDDYGGSNPAGGPSLRTSTGGGGTGGATATTTPPTPIAPALLPFCRPRLGLLCSDTDLLRVLRKARPDAVLLADDAPAWAEAFATGEVDPRVLVRTDPIAGGLLLPAAASLVTNTKLDGRAGTLLGGGVLKSTLASTGFGVGPSAFANPGAAKGVSFTAGQSRGEATLEAREARPRLVIFPGANFGSLAGLTTVEATQGKKRRSSRRRRL
jgi:hypothetical protein